MSIISSPPSATIQPVVTITSWWLKDPQFPALNLSVLVTATDEISQTSESATVHSPLGRAKPIVVADVVSGEDGTIELGVFTATDWVALRELLVAQRPLLLQNPLGEQRYLRLSGPRSISRPDFGFDAVNPMRTVKVPYVEVDAP